MNKSHGQNSNDASATNIYQISDVVQKYRARYSNDEFRSPFLPVSADSVVVDLPRVPGSDQRVILQQQAMSAEEEAKAAWLQRISAARFAWEELSERELLEVDGNHQKLVDLVQQRYATTAREAVRQVKLFFDTCEI